MTTIEDLLSEVASRGLRVNNLFQLEGGTWRANITDGERYWEFGSGDNPVAALQAALHITTTEKHSLGIAQSNQIYNPSRSLSKGDVSDLLGNL